jgi:ribosomal protein S18 acetylase RimI-like enzyme
MPEIQLTPPPRYLLSPVNEQTIAPLYNFFAPAKIPYAEKKLLIASRNHGEAISANIGNTALSCAVFYDPWGDKAPGSIYELALLATDERLRGLHLAQNVLEIVEKVLRTRQASQITLSSTPMAEKFYKKMGYKKQGQNSFAKNL